MQAQLETVSGLRRAEAMQAAFGDASGVPPVPPLLLSAARALVPEGSPRAELSRALAAELEIQGTPAFVFGDRMLRGFAPVAAMEALVAEARAGG